MNPAAFSRYFVRLPAEISLFLRELRLDHAARELAESSKRIADSRPTRDSQTLSSFNRWFRRRMSCTPRRYRHVLEEAAPIDKALLR